MDSDARKILEDRAHTLSVLQKHASWPEFKAELDRKRERERKALVGQLLTATNEDRCRLIDDHKGFDRALHWAVKVVEEAENTLERYLRQTQEAEELDVQR